MPKLLGDVVARGTRSTVHAPLHEALQRATFV
jgi:hypothetical protein